MLRNPVKMVWSYYCQMTFQGQEDQKDFFTAWELQDQRRNGMKIPAGLWCDSRMLLYKDVCALGSQLKKALKTIDRDRPHIELQDDLKHDPRGIYLRILDVMGVPDDGRTEFRKENTGRKIKSPLVYNFLRSQPVMSTVIAAKKALGLKTLGFGRPDLPMPPDVRSFLTKQFQDEIHLIEEILDRDLSN